MKIGARDQHPQKINYCVKNLQDIYLTPLQVMTETRSIPFTPLSEPGMVRAGMGPERHRSSLPNRSLNVEQPSITRLNRTAERYIGSTECPEDLP
jgi:hypothetical protein